MPGFLSGNVHFLVTLFEHSPVIFIVGKCIFPCITSGDNKIQGALNVDLTRVIEAKIRVTSSEDAILKVWADYLLLGKDMQ